MYVSGFTVSERHDKLLPTIGAFTEEKEAYALVTWLSIAAPVTVILTSLADCGLACTYLTVCHPWKLILAKESQVREGRGLYS